MGTKTRKIQVKIIILFKIVLNINIFIGIVLFITEDQKIDLNEKSFSYAQDPCANVKTGFGYSMSSKHKNGGSINFIKGETINLQTNQNSDKYYVAKQQKDPINNCDTKKGKINIFIKFIKFS